MLFFLIALLTLLQSATYVVVKRANRQQALTQIESSLRAGAQIFKRLIAQRNQHIIATAAILSRDHAFLEAFADAEHDRATTLSALGNLQTRIKADVILIASLEKGLLFDTQETERHDVPFPFPKLIDKAETAEGAYAFVFLRDDLYVMAITPLLAPDPIAWICPGFRIDDDFAREIKTYSNLQITFLNQQKLLATTLEQKERENVMPSLIAQPPAPHQIVDLDVGGEEFISLLVPLTTENGTATALLQRSLDKELAPYARLERIYLALALGGLLVSTALGFWIAGTVSKPVLQLADGVRRIGEGDYQHRIEMNREDEMGLLTKSFNRMSKGLAERDQARDLLGKVVSPAVAKELLGKDVTLGGEERELTILFSDIRGFTTMCEALSPYEMLEILNLYFTCMSTIVEKHGGIVDKYMGDAMMALFGAPLVVLDDADRAMRAALEMCDALDELNRQLKSKGRPEIAFGIGVHTGIVVAGNMGSRTRLNYTVIGDGVNIASRLEGLTKMPKYEARIIVSGATLTRAKERYQTRSLGKVAVKGKQKTTDIFALIGCET